MKFVPTAEGDYLRQRYASIVDEQSMKSPLRAGILRPEQRRAVEDAAGVFAKVFETDHVYAYWMNKHGLAHDQRANRLRGVFNFSLRESLLRGGLLTVAYDGETPVGASLREPADMAPESKRYKYQHGALPAIRAFGLPGALGSADAVAALDQQVAETVKSINGPVIYMSHLAVSETHRGGEATRLVAAPALALADELGISAILASSNPNNIERFGEQGFEQIAEHLYNGGKGPTLGIMVRPPQTSSGN